MDTIDNTTMQAAAEIVRVFRYINTPTPIIHTVTVILNGAHGGADLIVSTEDETHTFQMP
jgi:hypothetical protein